MKNSDAATLLSVSLVSDLEQEEDVGRGPVWAEGSVPVSRVAQVRGVGQVMARAVVLEVAGEEVVSLVWAGAVVGVGVEADGARAKEVGVGVEMDRLVRRRAK